MTGVHQDDPEEMYYTIKMTDGREKQTVESALAPKPVVSKGSPGCNPTLLLTTPVVNIS